MTEINTTRKLTRKDFESDQEVRWCPGCGDYAVLATMQRVLPQVGIMPENTVFVSGIGCASRFPYYMDTYGFHTIHGRATAVATGLKMANPDLSVWIVMGDGDGLSIGLSHLIHLIRRNLDVNILLLNNQIYGLTKGQYSPTSRVGKVTKSSPYGSLDEPLNPVSTAISANCGFVARAIDTDAKNLGSIITEAVKHKGTSFIEVFQNCNVYNDGVFAEFADKKNRPDNTVYLKDGQQLYFGKEMEHGLALDKDNLEIKVVENFADKEQELITFSSNSKNYNLAYMLSKLYHPEFPVPLGIFRNSPREVFEEVYKENYLANAKGKSDAVLDELLSAGNTWELK